MSLRVVLQLRRRPDLVHQADAQGFRACDFLAPQDDIQRLIPTYTFTQARAATNSSSSSMKSGVMRLNGASLMATASWRSSNTGLVIVFYTDALVFTLVRYNGIIYAILQSMPVSEPAGLLARPVGNLPLAHVSEVNP